MTHDARAPRPRSDLWLLPLCLLFACDEPPKDDAGELRIGLWGQDGDGEVYSLHGAIALGDWDPWSLDYTEGAPTSQSFTLPAGSYPLELVDWYVMHGAADDPNPVEADATLISPNPVGVTIADGLSTSVTFEFQIDGDAVSFSAGTLDIDAQFHGDDGVCDPQGDYPSVLITNYDGQLGDSVGDGWQSFTSPRTALITWVDINTLVAQEPDGYTIEIREGVGPDGPLLGSVDFPCQHDGYLDWVFCAPTNVVLDEGATYTIVSHGLTNWQVREGALPGATSSEGNTSYRIFHLDAFDCL